MKNFAATAGFGLAIAIVCANAGGDPPASHEPSAARTAAYVPGLGEIMSLQQMRHAKLWLAGIHGNWPLANYELDELREGFDDASKWHPVHEQAPVAALIAKLTPAPLDAIGKAIERKNAANFKRSFDNLTAACNTCHRAAAHAFIQIKRPGEAMFANQQFKPSPK